FWCIGIPKGDTSPVIKVGLCSVANKDLPAHFARGTRATPVRVGSVARIGALLMTSLRVVWKRIALGRAQRQTRWLHCLIGAFLLALLPGLALSVGSARAASSHSLAGAGSLAITQPNYRGVVGGPPSTRVVVQGSSWMPFGSVTLTVTASRSSCGSISVGN